MTALREPLGRPAAPAAAAAPTPAVDRQALAAGLSAAVRGEVRFGDADRALYASDAGNYRQVPLGVVVPEDAPDVLQALAVCRRHGAPVLARGGGTGIPGQSVNAAVVLDFSKRLNRLLELDVGRRSALVEPGLVLDGLRDAARPFGLTFGPDPATHDRNTLGGMIANNSCGIHSVMAGQTADNVEELDVVLYDGTRLTVGATSDAERARLVRKGGRPGEIYARLDALRERHGEAIRRGFPPLPRRSSGFNLPALLPENGFHVARSLVGSEGTCALVLAARVRLVEEPRARVLLVAGFPDICAAADQVVPPMRHGPIALEAMDGLIFDWLERKGRPGPPQGALPDGRAWLLIEFGGPDRAQAEARARACMQDLARGRPAPALRLVDDPAEQTRIWKLREDGLGSTAKVPGLPETHEGFEDSSVPPARLGDYLRELRRLLDAYGYQGPFYGHFGQGCVHTRLTFDLRSADGLAAWRRFLHEAAALVARFGGSLSGEHGDGQARGELLPLQFGPELMAAFREFRAIWDPDEKLNPGKLVPAWPVDRNLREGAGFAYPETRTHFRFPRDDGSFARASDRCVGAGVCRRTTSANGVMCPSYMVTREEKHSTRGRARLLNEMLRGEVVKDGFRSEGVREALDLCLSCKGCRKDCPVEVDIATYKAEFLSHYYARRLRPRHAYASGLIHRWARLAAHAPWAANALTQTPGLRTLARFAAGYSQKRTLPRFAGRTFRRWFARRPLRNVGGPPVLLWADTFNDHFTPHVAQAAVAVLEDAGFRVLVPPGDLCCGRPLYDYGMLEEAERTLLAVLRGLERPLAEGVPVVGLEPSCVSVFRDELVGLFDGNQAARRLANRTFVLGEFLAGEVRGYRPPHVPRRALVHGHCHHQALLRFDDEVGLLRAAGLACEVPAAGCCGMAGAFGYEAEHHAIGLACAERVLLPAVRGVGDDVLVVADGFSCREMIRQETRREPLHLAEVLALGLPRAAGGREAAAGAAP